MILEGEGGARVAKLGAPLAKQSLERFGLALVAGDAAGWRVRRVDLRAGGDERRGSEVCLVFLI